MVLEWALKLEEDGIMGDKMIFTEKEKEIAKAENYTINNFYGEVSNSQIQQNSNNSSQTLTYGIDVNQVKELLNQLKTNYSNLDIQEDQLEPLSEVVEDLIENINQNNTDRGFISKGLNTIKSILEDSAKGLITSGIIYGITQVL